MKIYLFHIITYILYNYLAGLYYIWTNIFQFD